MKWVNVNEKYPEFNIVDSLGYKYMKTNNVFIKVTLLNNQEINFHGNFTEEHTKRIHPKKVYRHQFFSSAKCIKDFSGCSSFHIPESEIKKILWLDEKD